MARPFSFQAGLLLRDVPHFNGNETSFLGVLESVRLQVKQHLLEPLDVCSHQAVGVLKISEMAVDAHLLRVGLELLDGNDFSDSVFNAECAEYLAELACLDLGKAQDVLYLVEQQLRRRMHDLAVLLILK